MRVHTIQRIDGRHGSYESLRRGFRGRCETRDMTSDKSFNGQVDKIRRHMTRRFQRWNVDRVVK